MDSGLKMNNEAHAPVVVLSREARVRIGKHAWRMHADDARGYLLGRRETDRILIYAALPLNDFAWDRVVREARPQVVRQLAGWFGLEWLGRYRASEVEPPLDVVPAAPLLLWYRPFCCESHSILRAHIGGVKCEDIRIAKGKRLTDDVRQKRVLACWRAMLGGRGFATNADESEKGAGTHSNEARAVARILAAAERLERGESCQITVLMPICRLARPEHGARFARYLLDRSRARFLAGQTLSCEELIPEEEKVACYDQAFDALGQVCANGKMPESARRTLEAMYQRLWTIRPGWARVGIHATRRKLPDPDLLLVEEACRHALHGWFGGDWDYWLAQIYVCDYRRLRFIPGPESAPRFRDVADYFRRFYALALAEGSTEADADA